MTRRRFAIAIGSCVLIAALVPARANSAFDQRLPPNKQIAHVLNRLSFGPRQEDVDEARRLGIDQWIERQLHPERVAENPVLETKLRPLGPQQLQIWEVFEKYIDARAAFLARLPSEIAFANLPPAQSGPLLNGSLAERRATLDAMDANLRRMVLAGAPPQVTRDLPAEWLREAETRRNIEQDEQDKLVRRLTPPLADLLTPEQIRIVERGTADDKRALLRSLDLDQRTQVLRSMPVRSIWELISDELIEQKLYRCIYTNRQLEEVLVDFWMNHFNIFIYKGPSRVLLPSFERDAIRKHVFGRFRDMLLATARHPAMLIYLDNWLSRGPASGVVTAAGRTRQPGLNENYARELLELQTLGVDGGYTQEDVVAVARAFTGWTIYQPKKLDDFVFNLSVHDRGEKVVLGHVIPAMGGEQDGVQVIDILSKHPSTAKFIARKLAQRFVSDEPPQSLVDRMAATFTNTEGDLRAVLETLFSSPEFVSEAAWRAKLKSPLEMTVSALRATNASVTMTGDLASRIAQLGQPLYARLEPTGYPNTGEEWANTSGVVGRINFAAALMAGKIEGISPDLQHLRGRTPQAIAAELLQTPPPQSLLAAAARTPGEKTPRPSEVAALVLGSPEFQRR